MKRVVYDTFGDKVGYFEGNKLLVPNYKEGMVLYILVKGKKVMI